MLHVVDMPGNFCTATKMTLAFIIHIPVHVRKQSKNKEEKREEEEGKLQDDEGNKL